MTFRTDRARVKYRVDKDNVRSCLQNVVIWSTEVVTARRLRQHVWDKVVRTVDPFRNASDPDDGRLNWAEIILISAENANLSEYDFEEQVLKELR